MSEAMKKLKTSLSHFFKASARALKSLTITIGRGLALFMRSLKRLFHKIGLRIGKFHRSNMRRFTKWVDPRLEKYRHHPKTAPSPSSANPDLSTKAETATETEASIITPVISEESSPEQIPNKKPAPCAPTSQADFLKLLQQTPRDVLDYRARQIITMAFQLPKTHARDLMVPKTKITYVHDDEMLGPLTLDRLYKTGFDHFPVVDHKDKILGSLHTTSFNNLEIKETSTVREILDPGIYYIRGDYTLEQVLAAFLRVNCYFFLVVDNFGRVIGMLTFARLISFLFGDTITDHFAGDNDRLAVAKRKGN